MKFETIYKKYYRSLLNKMRLMVKDEMTAEELCNDAFVKAYKKADMYKEDEFAYSTWLFSIAKNGAIDYLRKKHVETTSLEDVYVDWVNGDEDSQIDHLMVLKDTQMNPLDLMIEKETSKDMFNKFDSLSENEKIVASLHYFDGLSYDEVAEQLSLPLGTVKARLHSARASMMEALPVEMRK